MIKLLIGADIVSLAVLLWKFRLLPPDIPLYYSRAWGDPQIVPYWHIFILPVLLHAFVFLNIRLSSRLYKNDEVIQKILSFANIFMIIFFPLVFIRIILLVT